MDRLEHRDTAAAPGHHQAPLSLASSSSSTPACAGLLWLEPLGVVDTRPGHGLTMAEGLKLAAQALHRDVAKLSRCAA